MKIADKTREGILNQIEALLKDYEEEIDEAYCKSEKKFSIGFKVDLIPNKDMIRIKTGISFTQSKIKDMVEFNVSETQKPLPFKAVGE